MELIQVTLNKEKETKNMVRYLAPGEDAQRIATIPLLYVRKTSLAAAFNNFPKSIKITIET